MHTKRSMRKNKYGLYLIVYGLFVFLVWFVTSQSESVNTLAMPILSLACAFMAWDGYTNSEIAYRTSRISRVDHPISFWTTIAILMSLSFIMILVMIVRD